MNVCLTSSLTREAVSNVSCYTVFACVLLVLSDRWHSGVLVTIVTSQQEDPEVDLQVDPWVAFCARSPHALGFPPTIHTVQIHVD